MTRTLLLSLSLAVVAAVLLAVAPEKTDVGAASPEAAVTVASAPSDRGVLLMGGAP